MALWTTPVGDRHGAEAAFAELYTDPVVVNGAPLSLAALVDRARALQQAFEGLSMQIVDRVDTPDRVVIAFLMRGRQVGSYPSPLGSVPPSGRDVQVRTIDVLAVEDGRISAIWVVADELGLLTQVDAVGLTR
jgi:predicted ester cyclase